MYPDMFIASSGLLDSLEKMVYYRENAQQEILTSSNSRRLDSGEVFNLLKFEEVKPGGRTVSKEKPAKIVADGHEITIRSTDGSEYISLTDIAKYDEDDPLRSVDDPAAVIANWLRSRSTISFLGLWESLYNQSFNVEEFERLKYSSGRPAFTLSPKKWIESTGAIGITSRSGRYGGGTYAHKDIAFEFASWVSPKFKLMLIVDYQRVKGDEGSLKQLDWGEHSGLSRMATPVVPEMQPALLSAPYTDDDIVNLALFGYTEEQWARNHPDATGGLLDNITFSQSLVRSSLASKNKDLAAAGVGQAERISRLNADAIEHMNLLKIHGKNIQRMDNRAIAMPPNVVPVPALPDQVPDSGK